ncbi:MAG: RHS repeat-associated core domain-containing protein, partial [Thioalkalivibrio sp.]|nr:RHS repeat-associated core domain-containing protein [Thioalkalivibrio sp.]
MISRQSGSRDILYLYTADDERIWAYDLIANRSDYTIRDLDRKVLRVFDENWGSWSWKKDFLHRGTTLLGSSSPAGAYHYTVDHLGTPRYITNAWRQQIGRHAYYPFGEESTNPAQNDEFRKFTGHERDKGSPGSLDYLDYMHARYYRPVQGRFLSVDPTWDSAALAFPQSWNRYSYVLNNPINLTDPDGKCPTCRPEDIARMAEIRRMAAAGDPFALRLLANSGRIEAVDGPLGLLEGAPGKGVTLLGIGFGSLKAGTREAIEETLSRLGTSKESAARLGRKAAEAEEKIGIHGVSVSAGKPTSEASQASRSAVEKAFKVHNTPTKADPLHRTVELPKPVTRRIVDIFNELFGRK